MTRVIDRDPKVETVARRGGPLRLLNRGDERLGKPITPADDGQGYPRVDQGRGLVMEEPPEQLKQRISEHKEEI